MLLAAVPPWVDPTGNTEYDTKRLFLIANECIRASPSEMRLALRMFSARFKDDPLRYDPSKAFLLVRTLFYLPEQAAVNQRITAGWRGEKGDLNADGTINLGWPIHWRFGRPRLDDRFEGYNGEPYDPVADYDAFLSRFPLRRLKEER